MASSLKPLTRTYTATGSIPAYSFVKFDTSSAGTTTKNPGIQSCASGAADGIAQNDTAASTGDSVEVAFPGGGALLTLGGTVAAGNSIKATTAGVGIVTASSGDHASASAVEGGLSGDIIGVNVVKFEKSNSDAT